MADNPLTAPGLPNRILQDSTNVLWPGVTLGYVTGGTTGAWTMQTVDTTHCMPVAAHNNANRNAGVLHRNAITATDKLLVPTVSAGSAISEAGSNLANTAYNYTAAAFNRWGATTAAGIQAITPTANQAVRIPITQVAGADGYDIFLSVDAAPKWVGRITEAQRATGDQIISAVGVTSARAGSTVAGTIDVGIVGTGVISSAAPFSVNSAYTPASVTPVNCTAYGTAQLLIKLAVTDLRSLPTLNIIPFYANQVSGNDWHAGALQTIAPLSAAGLPLEQGPILTVNGATGLVVLVDTISGQGAAASIWLELA